MLRRILLAGLVVSSATAQAAVYQCKVNGQTIFSDQPCGENAKEIEIRTAAPSSGSSMVSARAQEFLKHRDQQAKLRRIDRDIDRQEQRKADARRAMDDALIRYQRQKAYANNNLAGAVWEGSLAEEAEVLRQRFQAEIDSADREIDRLREERQRILDSD